MNYIQTEIDGVWLIEPTVYGDQRGYFMESFKQQEFEQHIGRVNFLQDNESKSVFGVLRGLHYQQGEYSQAKLVRVIKGTVLDVAVDLRTASPTFGKHISVELSEDNKRQLFIPRGFAHGFLVLSDEAIFTYKVDNYYTPQAEATIMYNDPQLKIDWPVDSSVLIVSIKINAEPLLPRLQQNLCFDCFLFIKLLHK
jgi:dTDP-4-dehydrorhamnose 3,5-epimerase